MHTSAPARPKTPHYRIDDPQSGLSVRFTCDRSAAADAPKVRAQLTHPRRATVFASRTHAAECFARYLAGQPLDICRVDEVAA